jgi:hypothetical protein
MNLITDYFQNKIEKNKINNIQVILNNYSQNEQKEISVFLINNDKNINFLKNNNNTIKINENFFIKKKMNKQLSIDCGRILGIIYNFYEFNDKLIFDITNLKKINIDLIENGVYIYENKLSDVYIQNLLNHLNHKTYISHTQKKVYPNHDIFSYKKGVLWIKNQNEIINNIFIKNLITDHFILNVVQNYLGCKPILSQVNFWISNKAPLDNTQKFHQDRDDIRFIKVFIYLNDVSLKNGAHYYVKGSLNNLKFPSNSYNVSHRIGDNFIYNNYKDKVIQIEGKKGSIIFEDTSGFHKGSEVKEGHRFMLQLQYVASTQYYTNQMSLYGEKFKLSKEIYKDVYEKYHNLFLFCKLV